ncbi:hypothetical protein AAHA92_30418 [Salvia divinorum]|uniref:Uncharacterized protein n=1 Tax=Salvia divinorum TaxID=28513 RepID=A0ABD1FQS4_SALDI
MTMKCLNKMITPMRKAWTKFSRKISLCGSSGHIKLQRDVKSCEYEDVHVLWEMLNKSDTNLRQTRRNSSLWKFVDRCRSC